MKRKFLFIIFLIIAFTICLISSCNKSYNTKKIKQENYSLIVFAAASLTESLNEISKEYTLKNPNIEIYFNFDSSGTLKTQIEEGADCDLFISASPKQINQLEELNLTKKNTTCNLLENKIVLATTILNKNILSFDDMFEKLKNNEITLAIGNSDVPVGQYTKKIFDYYKIDENEIANNGVLTYGSNVKEITSQVDENIVDCGILYATDAYSAQLKIVDFANEEMCGNVIYPATILEKCGNEIETKKFLDFLKSDISKKIFEEIGFNITNQ